MQQKASAGKTTSFISKKMVRWVLKKAKCFHKSNFAFHLSVGYARLLWNKAMVKCHLVMETITRLQILGCRGKIHIIFFFVQEIHFRNRKNLTNRQKPAETGRNLLCRFAKLQEAFLISFHSGVFYVIPLLLGFVERSS